MTRPTLTLDGTDNKELRTPVPSCVSVGAERDVDYLRHYDVDWSRALAEWWGRWEWEGL